MYHIIRKCTISPIFNTKNDNLGNAISIAPSSSIKKNQYQDALNQLNADKQAINDFILQRNSGKNVDDSIALSMKGASQAAVEHARAYAGAADSVEDYERAQLQQNPALQAGAQGFGLMAVKAKAASIAMKGLALAGNMLFAFLVSKAIQLVLTGIDNVIHSTQKAKEASEDAFKNFTPIKSELSDINKELEENSKRIDELNAKAHLSYIEKEELKNLKEATSELKLQQDIKNRELKNAAADSLAKSKKAFKKEFGSGEFTIDEVKQSTANITDENSGLYDSSSNLKFHAAMIEKYQEDLQKALDAGDKKNAEEAQKQIDIQKTAIEESISTLSNYKQQLNELSQYSPLSAEDAAFSEQVNSALKLAYTYVDKDLWNSIKLDDVFSTDGIEKTKSELIQMAKEGTLDESVLQSYAKLNQALKDSNLILGEGETAASLFHQKIVELASAEQRLNDFQTIDSVLVNYKEQIDGLQDSTSLLKDALSKLTTGELHADNVIDLIQKFPDLSAYVDMTSDNFGNLKQGLQRLISSDIDRLTSALQEIKPASEEDKLAIDSLVSSLQQLSGFELGSAGFSEMASSLERIESSASGLTSALNQLSSGTALSQSELAKLALQYPKLLDASNLFTEGSVSGQQAMINSVLDMYESQYDAVVEEKIAELTIEKQAIENQIAVENEKAKVLSQLTGITLNGKLNQEAEYQDLLQQLWNLEGENYVTFENGKLKVNADSMTKMLIQEDEKGTQSVPIWQGMQNLISGTFEKGGEGGLISLNILGTKLANWVTNAKSPFLSLANTIKDSLVGKIFNGGNGFNQVDTDLSFLGVTPSSS